MPAESLAASGGIGTTPEPGTLILLGTALLAGFGSGRRKYALRSLPVKLSLWC
ncbi:MAG: PEP-CTERM sorting domain-containing protein [Terriglobia bacterium]